MYSYVLEAEKTVVVAPGSLTIKNSKGRPVTVKLTKDEMGYVAEMLTLAADRL